MLGGFSRFVRGMLRLPVAGQGWLIALLAANMGAPLFFLGSLEARIVLGTFVVAAMMMMVLTAVFGFTRILGVGHFVWFPLLAFLRIRMDTIPAENVYGIWIRAVMVLNALSLVLDVVDVVRFARGDRGEMVAGL